MKYIYRGPMPVDDGDGGLVRPLDVREFGSEPDWGPWEPVKEETDGTAGTQAGMETDTQAGTSASSSAASVDARTALLTVPEPPKGM